MSGEHAERTERRIRIETETGSVEGILPVAAILRTLDDLNQTKDFITIQEPVCASPGWSFGHDDLAINKRSILFVLELSNPPRRSQNFAGTYSRGSMRLLVGRYQIEGFLHVPPGGECLKRLNQGSHAFVSLTSVSVVGPTAHFATPFLAVNRRHILAAQEVFHEEDDAQDEAGSASDPMEMSFEVSRNT